MGLPFEPTSNRHPSKVKPFEYMPFTFSIPKYAAKVIAGGNDVEKALAKDVLAYIRAAYNYEGFASFNTADDIFSGT